MKLIFTVLILSAIVYCAHAHCYSDERLEEHFQKHEGSRERAHEINEQIKATLKEKKEQKSIREVDSLPVLRIPVVWHVLYSSSLPGSRVSRESIEKEMFYLNQWFNGENENYARTNSRWDDVRATGEDIRIQFELASFDESGNPTTGIQYKETSVAETCVNEDIYSTARGGFDIWDNSLFMNVYTCGLIDGLLGYSSFPFAHEPEYDGTVLAYPTVGDPAFSGNLFAHEIGHYLGLFHTFQGGCANPGDYVDDTPPTSDPALSYMDRSAGCLANYDGCDTGVVMIQNAMDYSLNTCLSLFTKDQAAVMRFWLEEPSSARSTLTTSIGLGPACPSYDCTNRNCGDDGCDGICGYCNEDRNEFCNVNGVCELVPPCPSYECTNKVCGADGCGGTCGECEQFLSCSASQDACSAPNEICQNAITVDISQASTNFGNNGGSDTPVSCGIFELLKPVWYTFTATQDAILLIDTFGSVYDTAMAVYSGSCNSLSCIEYNDDAIYYEINTSEIELSVEAQETYFIAVGGWDTSAGVFQLNINPVCSTFDCTDKTCGDDGCGGSCGTCESFQTCSEDFICIHPNNVCDAAETLTLSGNDVIFADNTGSSVVANCSPDEVSSPLWYTFVAPSSSIAVIDTYGSQVDTVLAVYSGNSCGTLSCIGSNDDDGQSLSSKITFNVVMNQRYYIAVGAFFDDEFGFIQLNIDLVCPSYDCDGKNCGDDGCGGSCGSCDSSNNFFCNNLSGTCEFIPPCPTYDCDGKNCGPDGCGGECGEECHFSQVCDSTQNCASSNEICQNAMTIVNYDSFDPQYFVGSTSGSTQAVSCGSGTLSNPLWYTFTSQVRGIIYADVYAFDYSGELAVFSGNNCNNLVCVDYSDYYTYDTNISPLAGLIEFNVEPGQKYYIVVSTNGAGGPGPIQLQTQLLEILPDPSATRTPTRTRPAPSATSSKSNQGVPATPSNSPVPVPSSSRTPDEFSNTGFTSFSSDSSTSSDSSSSSNSSSSSASKTVQLSFILLSACLVLISLATF